MNNLTGEHLDRIRAARKRGDLIYNEYNEGTQSWRWRLLTWAADGLRDLASNLQRQSVWFSSAAAKYYKK